MISSSSAVDEQSPTVTVERNALQACAGSLMDRVGLVPHGLSEQELNQHVSDLGRLIEQAHAEWIANGDLSSLAQAEEWIAVQKQSIRVRDELYGAKRHQEFEDRLSAGVDYFQSHYALELGRSGNA